MSAIDDLKKNTSVPFEQARAMSPSVYTDPSFLNAELSQIFARDWFCVGRIDALNKPGDYLTLDLADQPILYYAIRLVHCVQCRMCADIECLHY